MLRLSRPRRAVRAAAGALAIGFLAPLTPLATDAAIAAPKDDLEAKQQEAAQLEREIAANGTRISMLDEAYNETQLQIENATRGITEAQARFDEANKRTNQLKGRLEKRAASLYLQSAGDDPMAMLEVEGINELGSRSKYGEAAAEEDADLIDELSSSQEDLREMQSALEKTRNEARGKEEELAGTRAEIVAAQDKQQELLSNVEGEIADLVAKIEADRRREEEARARAELEQRQREEAQRVAAERQAASNNSGSSSSPAPRQPGAPAPNVPAPNGNAQVAVDTAKAQLGKPYRYAGSGPDSFDCSGLTMYSWAAAGVGLPHSSRAQYAALPHVSMEELAPGDLVFYGSPIHHVGIYVGNGSYIHAPQTGDVVKVSSIYRSDYAGAARPG
jgi:cell wall-associated NlpC family hydrolase